MISSQLITCARRVSALCADVFLSAKTNLGVMIQITLALVVSFIALISSLAMHNTVTVGAWIVVSIMATYATLIIVTLLVCRRISERHFAEDVIYFVNYVGDRTNK